MGLDGVALILELERRFGIQIPDQDAASLRTSREVVDYVITRVPQDPVPTCLSQAAFYRIRAALLAELGLERREVRVRSRLDELVPRRRRRAVWGRLPAASGLARWPSLKRSTRVVEVIVTISLLAGAVLYVQGEVSLWVIALATALCLATGYVVTTPLATRFPDHLPTLGGLAQSLAVTNAADAPLVASGWSRDRVRAIVRDSVIEELGVPRDFDDDADFVHDLGLS